MFTKCSQHCLKMCERCDILWFSMRYQHCGNVVKLCNFLTLWQCCRQWFYNIVIYCSSSMPRQCCSNVVSDLHQTQCCHKVATTLGVSWVGPQTEGWWGARWGCDIPESKKRLKCFPKWFLNFSQGKHDFCDTESIFLAMIHIFTQTKSYLPKILFGWPLTKNV